MSSFEEIPNMFSLLPFGRLKVQILLWQVPQWQVAGSGESVRFNFEGNLPEITKIKSGIGRT